MAFQIANQTSTSLLRLIPTPAAYSRPGDWLTITDTVGEVQFLMSDAASPVAAISTVFTRGATGNIYIAWGDGVTDTISTIASTTTNHTYATGGTPSSLGYNMWKIRVYGDTGTVLTNIRIVRPTTVIATVNYPSSVLEAVYGNGTQTTGFGSLFQQGGVVSFPWIDFVKLPVAIPASFNGDFAFYNCSSIRKIILPTSTGCTQIGSAFTSCGNLIDLTFFQSMPNCASFNDTLNGCYSLSTLNIGSLSVPNLVSMNSAFANMTSLTSVVLPTMPKCTNFNTMFSGCRSLLSFEWTNWPTIAGAVTFTSVFASCSSLEYFKIPAVGPTGGTITMASAFSGCSNLKNFVIPPTYTNITSLNATFSNCVSLATCILPTSIPSLSDMQGAFNGCSTLQQITLPTTVAATIVIQSLVTNCFELGEILIPSSYNVSSLQLTFSGCSNARTITLPNNAQNLIPSMANTFAGCSALTTVILPTSMTTLGSMNGTFSSCQNLTSITLPSSLASVGGLNSFSGCINLVNLTLPTNMPGLTSIVSSFTNCRKLKSIVLPATAGNITSCASAFSGCHSLTSITFPATGPSTGLTTMNSMLLNTPVLATLTNTSNLGNPATGAANVTYVDGTSLATTSSIPTLDFSCKFSKFDANGAVGALNGLTSLRLRNNGAGQYGGVSPQIEISYTSLSQAALVQVFNDLPTVTTKTINITGSSGAASLTAPERAIATGKGWTITG